MLNILAIPNLNGRYMMNVYSHIHPWLIRGPTTSSGGGIHAESHYAGLRVRLVFLVICLVIFATRLLHFEYFPLGSGVKMVLEVCVLDFS